MRTRFAPSPTGYLHTGNLRVALLNYFVSFKTNGYFLLRIDDTDKERSKEHYEQAIKEDLAWLGLSWQETFRQSDRMDRYNAVIEQLKDIGRLYACYETPEELELKRKARLNRGLPPIYDRQHYHLSDSDKKALEQEGRKPHWRFLLHDETMAWHDHIHHDVKFDAAHVSDPVLVRSDNLPLYTLTSVVDDGDYDISLIIRGEDHLVNTAVQIQVFQALNMAIPQFGHIPRMMDEEGGKLSKRTGSLSLRDLRQDAILPETIKAYLMRIGSNIAASNNDNHDQLAQECTLDNYGRAQPKFISDDLIGLNSKMLHMRSFNDIAALLDELSLPPITEDIWALLSNNLVDIRHLESWVGILQPTFIPPTQTDDVQELLQLASTTLQDYDHSKEWLKNLQLQTGLKGKQLFMPIRLALSGRHDGPALGDLIAFLGATETTRRLAHQ